MTDATVIKKDLLKSKCDEVLGSMRSRTPLTYKGFPSYATFQPPPYDIDETTGEAATFDSRHWAPLPHASRLDRQALMARHHFVAEPDWLPPVQTVQHRVPRPRSRGVKLRSVEAIVNDTQRQKALSNEERAGYMTARTPPRQQPPAQRPPPAPKSKVLDFLNEIKSVSRPSSSNSTGKSTPTTSTQNGKKSQQQPSTPNKKPLDHPFKKPGHPSTATPPPPSIVSTTPTTTSTPRSASRPTMTEKPSTKPNDVVSKSRPQSTDTNLDLFITKQFLINDMGDPAATRHLEDLSRSNVIAKRPILRVRIMLKKKSPTTESKSKQVVKKSKHDTQASPVVSSDPFNLPTGTIPTEFIRSMKIRKKSKSDQAAAAPPSHKQPRSHHMVELEEGETISPSPSPRRPLSMSPTKPPTKRQRDDPTDPHSRRNKTSKKDVAIPLSSSSSSSSTSSRHDTKSRRDEERKRLERSSSGGDDDSRRRSRRSSSGRDDDRHHHRSSQRSRHRRSSRSRSPRRRSSSSSSNTRSSSLEKSRRHTPTTTTPTTSRDTLKSVKSSALNNGTPKESTRTKDLLGTPAKELAPTPTASVPSPAVLAATKNTSSPAISAIKNSAIKVENEKQQHPSATAENADTPDQFRIFSMMFQKLALAYKRRGDHAETEIAGLLDHMHAFLNYILAFHFQDRLGNDHSQKNWDTLHPFTGVLLQKLRSPKNKERQDGALYGLCQRMNALVHFYTFSWRERMVKPKVDRMVDSHVDEAKRVEYCKTLQKALQDYELAYQGLRDSDKYMAFEVIQAKFPVSYQNVCVLGQLGAGIVLGGEAGVSVGPMFPLIPHARLHHAAIMAKCLLQEFVDKEQIDYRTITNTEDYM